MAEQAPDGIDERRGGGPGGIPEQVKIVGLGGSLGHPSRSIAALNLALRGAASTGAETELLSLGDLALPMYLPGARDYPDSVRRLVEETRSADGMIWSSPLYHGTISGAFKNALDWLQLLAGDDPPYLADKVIGLISTSGGTQGLQAINTMEFAVRSLRALAVPLVVPVPQARSTIDEEGRIGDERIESSLRQLGSEVARVARSYKHGSNIVRECEKARERMAVAVG